LVCSLDQDCALLFKKISQGLQTWQIAMASGWESEVPEFEPQQLQATFDPGFSKK